MALLADEQLLDPTCSDHDHAKVLDNPRAKRGLITNCSESILKSLLHFDSAPEIWEYLYTTYSGENPSRKFAGIKKLASIRLVHSSMKENLLQLKQICHDTVVASGNDSIKIEELGVAMFLNCLPTRFASIRLVPDKSTTGHSLNSISAALLAKDERQNSRDNSAVHQQFSGYLNQFDLKIRCIRKRFKSNWWTCDPSLHPSKKTCPDCGIYGNASNRTSRCKNDSHKRSLDTAGISFVKDDDEDWSPAKPFAAAAKRKRSSNHPQDLRYALDSGCTQSIFTNKDHIDHYTESNLKMTFTNNDYRNSG